MDVYKGRTVPTVQEEELLTVNFMSDIIPQFYEAGFGAFNRATPELDLLSQYMPGYTMSAILPTIEPKWNEVIDILSVEIQSINDGKVKSFGGASNVLTKEQKHALVCADLGTEIGIKVRYRYDLPPGDERRKEIFQKEFIRAVVPKIEAEFPCGNVGLTGYFNQLVWDVLPESKNIERVPQATVSFTINEKGEVSHSQLVKPSGNAIMDKLLIEAVQSMPTWKPACNSFGVNVKEEITFNYPFYFNGC